MRVGLLAGHVSDMLISHLRRRLGTTLRSATALVALSLALRGDFEPYVEAHLSPPQAKLLAIYVAKAAGYDAAAAAAVAAH